MINIKLNPRLRNGQFSSSPFSFIIDNQSYQFNPKVIYFFSDLMKKAVQNCFADFARNAQHLPPDKIDYQEISKILCGNSVKVTHDNIDLLRCLATTFQMEEISKRIDEFECLQKIIDDEVKNDINVQQLLHVESLLNDLNQDTFDIDIQESLKFINFNPDSKAQLLDQNQIDLLIDLIIGCCIAHYENISLYADLIMKLSQFVNISENVKKTIKNKASKVMVMKTNEIDALYIYLSKLGFFSKFGDIKNNYTCNERIERIIKFKNSSENLTRKNILSPRNNDIVECIRKDDVEQLHSILNDLGVFNHTPNSKTNCIDSHIFIPDEITSILPSMSYISMINYSALHQAVKCFKFLHLNKALIDRSFPTFAIAGGDPEIIHEYSNLFDKDTNPLFSDSRYYITAIHFHHNEVCEWLFQNRIANEKSPYVNQTDSNFSEKCFDYADFTILIFLIKMNYLNLLDVAKVANTHNNPCIYNLCYNITMKHKETFESHSIENIVSDFQSLQLKNETKSLIHPK